MPTVSDPLSREKTHNAVTATSATTPTGDEIVNVKYRKQNTLIFNVKPSVVGATATVRTWVYDSTQGWTPVEDTPIPRPGFDNTYATPVFCRTKGQACGITVTALSSGNITITAAIASGENT